MTSWYFQVRTTYGQVLFFFQKYGYLKVPAVPGRSWSHTACNTKYQAIYDLYLKVLGLTRIYWTTYGLYLKVTGYTWHALHVLTVYTRSYMANTLWSQGRIKLAIYGSEPKGPSNTHLCWVIYCLWLKANTIGTKPLNDFLGYAWSYLICPRAPYMTILGHM